MTVMVMNISQIGDQHAGGIVFQINEDGTGLVADLQDLGEWIGMMLWMQQQVLPHKAMTIGIFQV